MGRTTTKIPAPETTAPAAEALLTRRALAAVMHVHMTTISKWEQDGMPVFERGRRGVPSRYREVEARAWLMAREEAAETGASLDFMQTRARKEHWQALLAEQQHKARARELLPCSEVERAWGAEVAAVKAIVLSSYSSHADRVFRAATTEGLAGVELALRDLAFDVLRNLANPERPVETTDHPTPRRAPSTTRKPRAKRKRRARRSVAIGAAA